MAHVLITGVTSFLGRGIAKEMLNRGHLVYGLIRADSKNNKDLDPRIIKLICNMWNIEKLKSLKNLRVDVLIYLAWDGIGKEGRMNPQIQEQNIQNALNTMHVAKELGCKRVLFSGSQAEYGFVLEEFTHNLLHHKYRLSFEDSYLRLLNLNGDASVLAELPAAKDGLQSRQTDAEDSGVEQSKACGTQLEQLIEATKMDEDFPCNPKSLYGKAKLAVLEKAGECCKNLGMEYVHTRIFSVYGTSDHETSLIKTIIRAKKRGEKVELSACNQLWNYLYIDDCARAMADLSLCQLDGFGKSVVVNVASEDTRIMRAFAKEIDKDGTVVSFVQKEAGAEGTPFLSPCIKRLQALTNFKEKIAFEEGIREIEQLYIM